MSQGVYLLHFDRRYRHAGHYTGWAENIPARLAEHERGRGARLVAVVTAAGIGFQLARTWPGADRHKERRLKRSGGASRYCLICKAAARLAQGHDHQRGGGDQDANPARRRADPAARRPL